MQRNNLALGVIAVFVLAACAPPDRIETPAPKPAMVEKVVSTDVDTTWRLLISKLDTGDFKINAQIKSARTISVLVQSEIPSRYVDCGKISVRSKHPQFGVRNYNFEAANSVRYLVADNRVDQLVDVERRTSLNALASIHLLPSGQGTRVRIDAHYVMKFRTREFGNKVSTRSIDDSLDFTSLGRASMVEQVRQGATTKTVKVECRPTGELERRIVAVLGNTAG
jgi:hypothetical protein